MKIDSGYSDLRLFLHDQADVMGAADWWPDPELQMEYTVPAAPGHTVCWRHAGLFQPYVCSLAPQ